MLNFGEQLKTVRQARGYSLEYIEEVTGISRDYLQSLEEGYYEFLPDEFHSVEIVRNYAAIIGINVEDAATDFQISYHSCMTEPEIVYLEPQISYLEPEPRSSVTAQRISRSVNLDPPGTKNKAGQEYGFPRFSGLGGLKSLKSIPLRNYAAAGVFLVLVLWVGSTFIVPFVSDQVVAWMNGSTTLAQAEYNLARLDNLKQVQPSRGEDVKSALAAGTTLAADAAMQQAIDSTITLKLLAEQDCWLKTTVDGKEHFEGILPQGQTMTVTAQDVIKLKTSSAGSLSVSFNGESLKPLGEVNEVVEKEFR